MFQSLLQDTVTLPAFAACTAVSLILGLLSAALCQYKNRTSQSFRLTIAVLPILIQTVIMLVNGNIGAGVAVAGAFGLVRFRSVQGTAREITAIFMVMAIGLATGMGYAVLAVVLFCIVALVQLALCSFGSESTGYERTLRVTIPEDLDYEGIFDDIFARYTKSAELESVKTSNMGTLYELKYDIVLPKPVAPKAFLDELRTRNGNLNILCGRVQPKESL